MNLRDQNREDVARLARLLKVNGQAMINNEVGTGKTGQALLMVQAFFRVRKVLIIAGGQLSKQWERQAAIWLDSDHLGIRYEVKVLKSDKQIKKALLEQLQGEQPGMNPRGIPSHCRLYIMGPELFMSHAMDTSESGLNRTGWRFDMIIFDEAHRTLGTTSQTRTRFL